ncbi:DotU family type IV/VI secretion system protein [Shewanella psychropiezotolerans]|uniref:DotU family type IV/VI secretion system protein n=1 Tax=Shewanella psychropiezotolerans TaxID=2593655 RepID=A0ABX5WW86_9GAMM|nr:MULTISPECIES: type IVB secretion system protein IcmH/DotU [Shewanella]MPY26912.1 DotU family type IV/VI secretion system protein [Shewanella sp. YLB-07]QDO83360.1 DotU family type IV/VI secretion system protein [Shewanella psychropiezotolerans]
MSKLFNEEPTVLIRRCEANPGYKQVVEKSSYVDISRVGYSLDKLTAYGNPLLNTAAELLAILVSIPRLGAPRHIERFRQKLLDTIGVFKEKGLSLDYHPSIIEKSCFVFCAAFDEAILNTDWGVKACWENYSLMSKVFSQRNGGEAFFSLLENAALQPAKLTDFIELQYILLMLGFKGRYRYRDESALHEIKSQTYHLLRPYRSEKLTLTPNTPELIKRKQPWLLLSKRKVALLVMLTILFSYVFSEYQYRELSQPVLAQLDSLSQRNHMTKNWEGRFTSARNTRLIDETSENEEQDTFANIPTNWEVILAVFSRSEDATSVVEKLQLAGYHALMRDTGSGMQVYVEAVKNISGIRKLKNEINIRFGFNARVRRAQ